MTQGVRHSLHNVRHSLHDVRHSLQLTILNTIYITILKRARGKWLMNFCREVMFGVDFLGGMGVFPTLPHS